MITLHTFGPLFGMPDPSPFVTKADVLLKLSGLQFEAKKSGLRGAPKGKLPYIEDGAETIADSTFIRIHLERKYKIDFDRHLSPAEKGFAWAIDKMLEDNFYWAVLRERWMDDMNFDKGPRHFFDPIPAPMRAVIVPMVRRKVRKNLYAHGLGRHSDAEVMQLGTRVIDSLASILGDKPYILGAQPCGADATVFAFVVGTLTPFFTSALRDHAERYPNLKDYNDRLLRQFYPELKK